MALREEFTFPSSDGQSVIHAALWRPQGRPRGILQLSHGVAEYILRYDDFASFMAGQGFLVLGNDHLGHGLSRRPGAKTLFFGEKDGWTHVVDDLYALRCRMKEQYPQLPYVLMGHSMGSFLARTYLIRYPSTVDAAILMGTGQNPAWLVLGGRLLSSLASLRLGKDGFSPLIQRLAFGAYNKPFAPTETQVDWLSADKGNVQRYLADPLCGENASVGLFYEMMGGLRLISRPANLKKMDPRTPVFFISGQDDPVGQMGKGVEKACESFRKAGVQDLSIRLYPGLRHEILNEACRQTVYQDIRNWIDGHCPPQAQTPSESGVCQA